MAQGQTTPVDQNLTLQDLRVIIHSLKMQDFTTSVDPSALDNIKARIFDLPSAESLSQMAEKPKEISHVVKEVGEIMKIVESYPKNTTEYRDRHQSRTKLPPRYKVLEWRKNKMNHANNVVRELIKVSEKLDNLGNIELSNKLIVCAKNIRSDVKDNGYLEDIEIELIKAGLKDEAMLIKEAINPMWNPRNWVDKGHRDIDKTMYQREKSEKAKQQNTKALQKDRISVIYNLQKQISVMNQQIANTVKMLNDFDSKFELQGWEPGTINKMVQDMAKTEKELSELNVHLQSTQKEMGTSDFDFSPLEQSPKSQAAQPAQQATQAQPNQQAQSNPIFKEIEGLDATGVKAIFDYYMNPSQEIPKNLNMKTQNALMDTITQIDRKTLNKDDLIKFLKQKQVQPAQPVQQTPQPTSTTSSYGTGGTQI